MKGSNERPTSVIHSGPLTLSSLDSCLRGSLFRPVAKSKHRGGGSFNMGWEYVPFQNVYEFTLDNLQYATAEGVVTFAAIVDCLRKGSGATVAVTINNNARTWANALGLQQLVDGRWEKSFPLTPTKTAGCLTHPLWRYLVKDRRTCERTAERMSRQIEHILDKLSMQGLAQMPAAGKVVFQEALLNIFEHAYPQNAERVAFEAITITPVPRRNHLKALPYVTNQEADWFANNAGLMLEVAIADYGQNVPSSLWEAFADEHPNERERAASRRLGTREGRAERADLHHKISLWSFDHKSTRKRPEDFSGELAQLNWRGLHRALNSAAKFDSCFIMRSGQARTGYVVRDGKPDILETTSVPQHEFPGTSIILRIPLAKPRNRFPVPNRKPSSLERPPTIKLGRITSSSELTRDLTDGHTDATLPVGIVHPFRLSGEDGGPELLRITRSISPQIVSVHLFAASESGAFSEQLQAFESTSSARDIGIPRLLGLWSPGRDLTWRLVGLMPEYARLLSRDIEEHGAVHIPSDQKSRSFAEQLVRSYGSFMAIDNNLLQLKQFNAHLVEDDLDRAMQVAFESWATPMNPAWLFDDAGKYVRLPTGRLVKRYVSVFKMLYSDDTVAHAIGWRFTAIVKQLQREYPGLCIVTESPASYFIARILLQDQSNPADIYVGEPPSGARSSRPILFFADAIYRGETLGTLLRRLRECRRVICCLDLRAEPEVKLPDTNIKVSSLLKMSFDPKEVTLTLPPSGSDILEVDRVTHIPVQGPPAESFLLGTSDRRVFFINENIHLFRYGLHNSNGRLHVVSLSNNEILKHHEHELIEWVNEMVSSHLDTMESRDKPIDIIFFTRAETCIKEIIKELGTALTSQPDKVGRVFSSVLPFVPSGQREIFGRPTQELCYGLQRLNPTDLFFEAPGRFLAIYLDDACVTGRSLLNFLILVSKARPEQVPAGILVIPMLSRLSPAEERFYTTVCRAVTAENKPEVTIPFSFRPLFRLQVRSFEKLQGTFVYELAAKISNQEYLDPRLQKYIAKIMQRLESDLTGRHRGNQDLPILQHPFFSGVISGQPSISGRSIRIRHLIALQEQNVGVLGELLRELLDATGDDDFSLLTVLALELNLLEVPPLLREFRADIVELAIRALTSNETNSAIRSDAISVLSMTGQELIRQITKILPAIGYDSDLIDQFLVFLVTKVPRTNVWFEDLNNAIASCASKLPEEEYLYISGYVKSFFEVSEPLTVKSTPDAVHAIENLVSETSYHGKGLSALNSVNNWLSRKEQDRILTAGTEVQYKLKDAIFFVRKTVLVGLDGLVWWAEYENPNQPAAVAFRNARFQLIEALNHLETISQSLKAGPVGSDVVISIEAQWETLRKYTQRIGPEYFLSQSIGRSESEPTTLERWMPEFFCLPFEILKKLSPSFLPRVEVANVWEKPGKGLSIVLSPVPLNPVMQIFQLLLADMKNHGSDTGNRISLSLSESDAARSLTIDFEDRVRVGDLPGTGRSQSKVRALAEPLGLSVRFDPPRQANELYRVTIVFPDAMPIRCY